MNVSLPGWSYQQYTHPETCEDMERVYETIFDIDIDSIEAITQSSGPEDTPDRLLYTRIIGKSGRQYDINMPMADVRTSILDARKCQHTYKLLVQSN